MKLQSPAFLVIALALSAGAAQAEEFTLLIHESGAELARRDDPSANGRAYWAEYADYGRALQAAGVLRGGAALAFEPAAAQAGGAPALGGYFVIEAKDAGEARAWAERAPAVRQGGKVEVRRMLPNPAMR